MTDLTSTLQSLLQISTQYPGHTRVMVNGQPIQAIYFDAGNNTVPSVRITTDAPRHLKPITNADEQITSGWRNNNE